MGGREEGVRAERDGEIEVECDEDSDEEIEVECDDVTEIEVECDDVTEIEVVAMLRYCCCCSFLTYILNIQISRLLCALFF